MMMLEDVGMAEEEVEDDEAAEVVAELEEEVEEDVATGVDD